MSAPRDFIKAQEGGILAEYSLLVGLIAVVCIVALGGVGTKITALFSKEANF